MAGDIMIDKRAIFKELEKNRRAAMSVTPFMAAYYLGYMKSQKGEKIANVDIENLLKGACLSMGIDFVEDIDELFGQLFGIKNDEEPEPLHYIT